jgi:folate-binding protein YgfZ
MDRNHATWTTVDQATVLATGGDAVRFVDNFVTASIGALAVGGGTEAFVTDVRGWVIALVRILRTEQGLEIIAAAGLGERLRDHLEHYHIREAVDLADASSDTLAILVAGPEAADVLASRMPATATLPDAALAHTVTTIAGHAVRIVRITGQGADGFWVRGVPAAIDAVASTLAVAGVPRASGADLEAARIMAGYPAAIDIPEKTLPQELGRDALAISFTKGCYLGQETVARLDALGHVNRRLAIIAIESSHPLTCPTPIHHDEHEVGLLTSSCFDSSRSIAMGLGILHTKAVDATPLTVGGVSARVLAVPPSRVESL